MWHSTIARLPRLVSALCLACIVGALSACTDLPGSLSSLIQSSEPQAIYHVDTSNSSAAPRVFGNTKQDVLPGASRLVKAISMIVGSGSIAHAWSASAWNPLTGLWENVPPPPEGLRPAGHRALAFDYTSISSHLIVQVIAEDTDTLAAFDWQAKRWSLVSFPVPAQERLWLSIDDQSSGGPAQLLLLADSASGGGRTMYSMDLTPGAQWEAWPGGSLGVLENPDISPIWSPLLPVGSAGITTHCFHDVTKHWHLCRIHADTRSVQELIAPLHDSQVIALGERTLTSDALYFWRSESSLDGFTHSQTLTEIDLVTGIERSFTWTGSNGCTIVQSFDRGVHVVRQVTEVEYVGDDRHEYQHLSSLPIADFKSWVDQGAPASAEWNHGITFDNEYYQPIAAPTGYALVPVTGWW